MKVMRAGAVLALLFLAVGLQAQDSNDLKFSIAGARFNWAVVPTGADIKLNWGPLSLLTGAGYEGLYLGRDDASGDPLATSYQVYNSPNAEADLRYNVVSGPLTLWAGVAGRVDFSVDTTTGSVFPDRNLVALGSLKTGVTWNTQASNPHGVLSGAVVNVSTEWGPSFLSAEPTDFWRADLVSSLFVPVFDLESEHNWFSGYAAFRLNVRWIDGTQVPIPLLEPTEVRGYWRYLDTKLRTVGTAEFRLNTPSWWGVADVMPILFGFAEGGYYQGYTDSTTAASASGTLASIGGGLGLNFFGLATPTLTVALPLVEEHEFWYAINFSLKF